MADYLQRYGKQWLVIIAGKKYMSVPTANGQVFLLNATEPIPPEPPKPVSAGFAWPFSSTSIVSGYGPRDTGFHQGVDFAQPLGKAIPASNLGTVYNDTSVYHSGFGWHMVINHGVINGNQIYTVYGHMQHPASKPRGASIAKGETTGFVNSTGHSFGNHLHWETHVTHPGGGLSWSNPGTHMNPITFMQTYAEALAEKFDGPVINLGEFD